MTDGKVSVRYMVDDVDSARAFYTRHFGFEPGHDASSAFAEVSKGNLRLLLAGPKSSARPMPDGRKPEPGGWNRIHFVVDDIEAEVERLRAAGVTFRNDIVSGLGGRQILVDDPSGNPIEIWSSPPPDAPTLRAPVPDPKLGRAGPAGKRRSIAFAGSILPSAAAVSSRRYGRIPRSRPSSSSWRS